MGSGASQYKTKEEALAAGVTEEQIADYLKSKEATGDAAAASEGAATASSESSKADKKAEKKAAKEEKKAAKKAAKKEKKAAKKAAKKVCFQQYTA